MQRACSVGRTRSLAACWVLGVALLGGCNRWVPAADAHLPPDAVRGGAAVSDTAATAPQAVYARVIQILTQQSYQIVEKDDANRRVTVRTHVDETSESRVTHITVQVDADGGVTLRPSGYLVVDNGTRWHRLLATEINNLKAEISGGESGSPSEPDAGSATAAVATQSTMLPHAWDETAPDGQRLTCLPVGVEPAQASSMRLLISTGEQLDLGLYVEHRAKSCDTQAHCPLSKGCPALGAKNPAAVYALQARLKNQSIGSTAQLVVQGQPVAVIDLDVTTSP